ncbi:transporter [Vibrio sp. UCD-FRSSP16_10]|uniref:MFS transporter n=1 Tax=unclassified Vibrio TaxID=2614977 RepID=UPI0008020784|nr:MULTISPECIES: MFS transporter [unclassified Vibrio]OBT12224.1 transporter [Vibrio sp. UCD-FRSSP16_30]OBT20521.1 transporter [Vibrio sp. UCD-FRSSP16_10]
MALSRKQYLALFGILLLATNLRGPFTSLAPVLDQIMTQLHLSSTMLGMLSSLPLLSFAIISPLSLSVLKKFGLKSSICIALLAILLGICLRSAGSVSNLYIGTILIGAGIAVGNVLLPVAVKASFPTRIAVVTSLYIFTMGIGSTVASTAMVPLSHQSFMSLTGWQLALLFNLVFVVSAFVFWFCSNSNNQHDDNHQLVSIRSLLKSAVAWQVTLTLGFNSFTFYSFAAWLPKMLLDHGMNEIEAGNIYGLLQLSTMLPGIVLIPILSRLKNTKWLFIATSVGVVLAALGLLFAPQYATFWTVMFGFCNCSTFVVSISFVGLRTNNASQAAALSAMSQSIGYAIATLGPPLLGYLYQRSGAWSLPLLAIICIASLCVLFGTLAARETSVS